MSDYINDKAYVLFDTVQTKFVANALKPGETHSNSLNEACMFRDKGVAMEYRNLFLSPTYGLNADKWIVITIGPLVED
jgi:hypothetical protein